MSLSQVASKGIATNDRDAKVLHKLTSQTPPGEQEQVDLSSTPSQNDSVSTADTNKFSNHDHPCTVDSPEGNGKRGEEGEDD